MRYVSTRGAAPEIDFTQATLAGLAVDGGLYIPKYWPELSRDQIAKFATCSYAEVATEVMIPFIGEALSKAQVLEIAQRAYQGFHHIATVPLQQLDEKHFILELFHGPTLAFKDVALQFLGLLFEHLLKAEEQHLTIIGATSGDTGSAAIHAVAGRESSTIFMLHPKGRVSDVQRRQMTTICAPNVYNIAVNGSFDDCQTLVKALLRDDVLQQSMRLSAVNSINWARVMAQVVYYFTSAVALGAPHREISFSVPTGNFGDVFAGYVARQMGLSIGKLIVATNENDILHRAFALGDYSANGVTPTITPSMDIQISSNFERLLFDLNDRDGVKTAVMMDDFSKTKSIALSSDWQEKAKAYFLSYAADQDETREAMSWAYEAANMVIDPHSAVGLAAARRLAEQVDGPIITLATAHPAKFRDAVERATGVRPSLPHFVGDLFSRDERFTELRCDYQEIRSHILKAMSA